jgi:phosphosulfolactate synthase
MHKGADTVEGRYWSEMIPDMLAGRVEKPRISGLTMVIDTGIPITMMRDLFELAASHIDFWKFGFASASVCPPERVADKVMLCQEYGILAYPGGTSLEIAISQGIWKEYLQSLWEHGIKVLEVSDGTIDVPVRLRREIIRTARKMGFTVLSEIGKKLPGVFLPVAEQVRLIHGDLNSGAHYIIMEGREGGTDIGVYDGDGNVKEDHVQALLNALGPLSTRLIWEAPLLKQQLYYVKKLGNKANLGNIKPLDVIALESIRRGLRSDTLRGALGLPDVPIERASGDGTDMGLQSGWQADGSTRPSKYVAPPGKPKLWTGGSHGGTVAGADHP